MMQILRPFVPAIKLNWSVLDQLANGLLLPSVAAASSRSDSLLPTPTVSVPLRVFGKPPFAAPVQFVAAVNTVSVTLALLVGGVVPFTFPSVTRVVAVPGIAPGR